MHCSLYWPLGSGRHGATVYLCKGQDGREEFGANAHWGNMHMKAIVLDARVAYTGSANLTRRKRRAFETHLAFGNRK